MNSPRHHRLGPDTLATLPPAVERPRYDRTKVARGILHLGTGAFHRAHQAVYTEQVLAADPRWGIIGVSLRSRDARERLAPQDGLYTVLERGATGVRARVVGSVCNVLYLPEDFPSVVRAFAHTGVRVVSLTVTEKGYCNDPATGKLARDHPGIAADLAAPERPQTAIGLLAAGLGIRELAGGHPVTILCCDNLPHNGRMLESLVREYVSLVDAKLLAWLDRNVTFPCTVVDRIVPATTPEDLDEVERLVGVRDEAAVTCEPFVQWVIEDRFAAPRPPWERAGAAFVADVAPYEAMKLRLLNASHSALAYLGALAGFEYVFETMREPSFVRFMERLIRVDAAPTLDLPAGVDLDAYARTLVERFANPVLRHRCAQIATDGSQKLPQRLLETARSRHAAGQRCEHVALAVAGWMRYVTGIDEQGRAIDVRDPLAAPLAARARAAGPDPAAIARALIATPEVFGLDLPADRAFVDSVSAWLTTLHRLGARAALQQSYG